MSRHVGHHHAEKAEMIHKLLAGKSGLSVFEPCAYKDSRLSGPPKPGECYKAYKKYANPFQHVAICWKEHDPQTDWLWQTHMMLVAKRKFDIVDLDGYGGPERLLLAGAVELVKDGGLLFCTYPCKGAAFQYPTTRKHYEAIYGGKPIPTEQSALAVRAGLMYNRRVEPVCMAGYDGLVLRVAYRVSRFTSIRTRMSDVKAMKKIINTLQVA